MNRVLIFGATSAIASETARLLAAKGSAFALVARNPERMAAVADDLRVRGASMVHELMTADLADCARHSELLAAAAEKLGGIDLVLVAHGTCPDQKRAEHDYDYLEHEMRVNLLSVLSLATHVGNFFEAAKAGTLVVLSSIAGDRGREQDYVFGTAKGGVALFLQGLRHRLGEAGVHILTIKAGPVDTPLLPHTPRPKRIALPEEVAASVVHALELKLEVAYAPWYWRWIMMAIRHVPEAFYKRMRL